MSWLVEIKPSAARELRSLPDAAKQEARELILVLYDLPVQVADTILEGHSGIYAARFYRGLYRMIYRVSSRQRSVIYLRVRRRGAAHGGLEQRHSP